MSLEKDPPLAKLRIAQSILYFGPMQEHCSVSLVKLHQEVPTDLSEKWYKQMHNPGKDGKLSGPGGIRSYTVQVLPFPFLYNLKKG